ncbi:MAG: hypothetical protein KatS3mg111_3944 [Pirellulaceae bacterium]|nr:MAG: hypothetical protein KatS3mg111_3944 [Pirellulaceae bacterium]
MTRPFRYWLRCTTIGTLTVLLTINPLWAGRKLRRLMHRRACAPVCCPCPCPPVEIVCPPTPCDAMVMDSTEETAAATPAHAEDNEPLSTAPVDATPSPSDTSPAAPPNAAEASAAPPAEQPSQAETPATPQATEAPSTQLAPATDAEAEPAPVPPPPATAPPVTESAADSAAAPPSEPSSEPPPQPESNPEPEPEPEPAVPAEPATEAPAEPQQAPERPEEPEPAVPEPESPAQSEASAADAPADVEDLFRPVPPDDSGADLFRSTPAGDSPAAPADDPSAPSEDPFGAPIGDTPNGVNDDPFGAAPSNSTGEDLFGTPADEQPVPESPEPAQDFSAPPSDESRGDDAADLFGSPATPAADSEAADAEALFGTPPADDAATPGDDLFGPAGESSPSAEELFGPADSDASSVEDLFGSPASAPSADDLFGPSSDSSSSDDDQSSTDAVEDLFGAPVGTADLFGEATVPVVDTSADTDSGVENGPASFSPTSDFDSLFGEPAEVPPSDDDAAWLDGALRHRTWRDNTGLYAVTARLIEIRSEYVRLLKDNGKTCTVPMRRLSAEDAALVQRVAAAVPNNDAVIYVSTER